MLKLQYNGIEQTSIHNHLLGETPRVIYMHVAGHGDPVVLASRLPPHWFTQMVRRLIFPGRSCREIQGGSSTCRFDRLVLTLARRHFTWWHLAITARWC